MQEARAQKHASLSLEGCPERPVGAGLGGLILVRGSFGDDVFLKLDDETTFQ